MNRSILPILLVSASLSLPVYASEAPCKESYMIAKMNTVYKYIATLNQVEALTMSSRFNELMIQSFQKYGKKINEKAELDKNGSIDATYCVATNEATKAFYAERSSSLNARK